MTQGGLVPSEAADASEQANPRRMLPEKVPSLDVINYETNKPMAADNANQ